jgi:hypothetical protein
MILSSTVKQRLLNATSKHSDQYLLMKASEELLELSEELLKYLKFADVKVGRRKQVHDVCVELCDVMLVIAAMQERHGSPEKDILIKDRMEIDKEIEMHGHWEHSSGTFNSVSSFTALARMLVQFVTKRKSTKDFGPMAEGIMEVRCHIYRLCALFRFSDTQAEIIMNEKLTKLENYNREIPNFGSI